ncbi:MAG: hypothetical protein P8H41_07205 [Schleiferiaceae bacterium]|nr:hypothetical protein [Schleiferiaceae bacterium]
MKILATLLIGSLAITMNGQVKKATEIHTRPLSLLQGVGTVGFELQTSDKTSILFDGGYGQSSLDAVVLLQLGGLPLGLPLGPGNTVTTFMVGTRLYLSSKGDEESISGSYITARHRSRFYSSGSYVANTNMMYGKKWLNDRMSLAAEFGLGSQDMLAQPGEITIWLILPTWAVTIGLRSK